MNQLGGVYPICREDLGTVTAEAHRGKRKYWVYLVGDRLVGFLGSSAAMADCKAEIDALKQLAASDAFKRPANGTGRLFEGPDEITWN